MVIHTIPINDIESHSTGTTCACKPTVEIVNDNICVFHNSFDGREALEAMYTRTDLNILIGWGWSTFVVDDNNNIYRVTIT